MNRDFLGRVEFRTENRDARGGISVSGSGFVGEKGTDPDYDPDL